MADPCLPPGWPMRSNPTTWPSYGVAVAEETTGHRMAYAFPSVTSYPAQTTAPKHARKVDTRPTRSSPSTDAPPCRGLRGTRTRSRSRPPSTQRRCARTRRLPVRRPNGARASTSCAERTKRPRWRERPEGARAAQEGGARARRAGGDAQTHASAATHSRARAATRSADPKGRPIERVREITKRYACARSRVAASGGLGSGLKRANRASRSAA